MKITLEFEIDEDREYDDIDLMDHMAGALSEFAEFEGAGVTCKKVGEK